MSRPQKSYPVIFKRRHRLIEGHTGFMPSKRSPTFQPSLFFEGVAHIQTFGSWSF